MTSSPSMRTVPASIDRSPASASIISVWPFPSMPAMPTISPARTSNEMPRTFSRPRSSWTRNPSTWSSGSPDLAEVFSTRRSTSRPTIRRARLASVAPSAGNVSTSLPRRRTVIRSAMSSTSFSLWVMKIDRLAARREAADHLEELLRLLRREHGRGLVEDEDVRLAIERLQDLDALLLAHSDVLDPRGRVDGEPVAVRDLLHAPLGLVDVEHDPAAGRLLGEDDVLRDRHHRDEHEVLVHHSHAGPDRRARRAEPNGRPLDDDLALVGVVQAVEDVHQRRLAGAVLAEQRMHLALAAGRS